MFSRLAVTLSLAGGLFLTMAKPAGAEYHYIYVFFEDVYSGLAEDHACLISVKVDNIAAPLFFYVRNGDKIIADTVGGDRKLNGSLLRAVTFQGVGPLPESTRIRIELNFYRETRTANQNMTKEKVAGPLVLTRSVVGGANGKFGQPKTMNWNLGNPPGGVTEFRLRRQNPRQSCKVLIAFTKIGPYSQ